MRIVVLDDIEISVENVNRLARRGDVRVYSGIPASVDEIVARAQGAEVILCSWTKVDEEVLDNLPDVRLISVASTGVDHIDVAAARVRGVTVCNVPSYATNAVAELALGLMLAVMRKIPSADRHVRRTRTVDWQPFQGRELHGATLGVVGTGVIGRQVARLGHCLGMSLIGFDPQASEQLTRDVGLRYVPLHRVFEESDVVTLHVPLMPETEYMVDDDLLRLMPRTAVIINTARARLIRQAALCDALVEGRIAGAGLDAVDLEHESAARLLELDQVVLTPHIGFNMREAVANLTAICTENAVRFLDGDPQNIAEPPAH
ncbi:MAG: 2-hydroxyacid dehydrogenase [Thermoleophilia bacterium]